MSGPPDPATLAARAGSPRPEPGGADLVTGPTLSSVQAFADLGELDRAMGLGIGYRRYANRSVRLLEEAISSLEGWGQEEPPVCSVTASGQAAMLLALSTLVSPEHPKVVLLRPCYGGSQSLLAGPLAAFGVELLIVDLPAPGEVLHQLDGLAQLLDARVACVVAETITSPLIGLLDLPRLVDVCQAAGVATVIDNTFATPLLLRPFEQGADIVFHSLTKSLSGHSDVLGGAVLVRRGHPAAARLAPHARSLGAVMAPFDAFLTLRGLRTAGLRVERASANAAALAELATRHPSEVEVHYPGSHSADEARLASRLLPRGRGSMLSLDTGDRQRADRLLAALPEVLLAPSLGDVATTVSHPALSSHREMGADQRRALGIGDGLLRLSVGVEATADLVGEMGRALDLLGARSVPVPGE